MAVRSKFLGGGQFSDAAVHTLYTVPTGMTAIVKAANFCTLTAMTAPPILWHNNSGSGDTVLQTNGSGGVLSQQNQWIFPWEVLEPGDYIWCQGDGTGTYSISVSGAELDGVAP